MDVARAMDQLYEANPQSFTKKRDALAKSLKEEGDDAGAKEVRAKKKPTQVAWVLNQLARRHPDDVARLVDVGRDLARAHRKALRGESGANDFRESIDQQRQAIRDVTKRAKSLMTDLGVSQTHLDEVSSALQAALIDPQVGASLEEGHLEKAPEATASFAGPLLADISPSDIKKAKAKTRAEKKAKAKSTTEKAKAEKVSAKAAAKAERAAAQKAAREAKEAKANLAKAKALLKAAEKEATARARAAEKAQAQARAQIEKANRLSAEAEEAQAALELAKKSVIQATART